MLVLKTGRLLLCAFSFEFEYGQLTLGDFRRQKSQTRAKVSVYTCTAVFLMFIMAIALWIIDVHKLITEVKMTLLSASNGSLSGDYAAALSSIQRLASVEDILYSYLVRLLFYFYFYF